MKNFINAFFESVRTYPDNTAVMDKTGFYSYTELDGKSNVIAHCIMEKAKERGVDIHSLRTEGKNGIRVAVLLPRIKDFMVAVIGILRSGCAVVPIDMEYPAERINFILDDSDAAILITDKVNCTKVNFSGGEIIFIEDIASTDISDFSVPEYNYSDPDIEGYLLYTSGSTGKPKGVIHKQSIPSFSYNLFSDKFNNSAYHTLCIAGFTFIASTVDLFSPLMCGASVYIASEEERKNIETIHALIGQYNIQSMFMPPNLYYALADEYDTLPLDFICISGAKFSGGNDLCKNVLEIYGSSEAGASVIHWIKQFDDCKYIGLPTEKIGTSVYILDEYENKIETPEIQGELCIVSPYLALGYNKLPEQTAAAFTDCPFQPGEKMFHTGDMVSWAENGMLVFHGRKDRMIKIRGYRVELDEIESVMQNIPEIKESAVVNVNINGSDKIVCYYSLNDITQSVTTDYFKSALSVKLADYMIPDFFIAMDNIPRNANGKKDYSKLKSRDIKTGNYVAPRTEKEKILCRAVAAVLKISEERVGIEDDFYALGGDSMTAIRLINYLRKENIALSVADLMNWKTVKTIAENVPVTDMYSGELEADQEDTPESTAKKIGWSWQEWDAVVADFTLRGEEIERIYPLLPLQEAMLAVHISDPKSWDYRLIFIYEFEKLPTEQQLRNVLDRLSIKHEVLRTAIIYEKVSVPLQAIVTRKPGLTMASVENEDDPLSAVKEIRNEILSNGFDLQKKPLFNVTCVKKTENSCYIILAMHHIIMDGWCVDILENDFEHFLSDELNEVSVKEIANQPGLYQKAVRELVDKEKKSALTYWKNLLSDYEERAEIPYYETIPEEKRNADNQLITVLPSSLVSNLSKLCWKEQSTLMDGLELAWALLLNTFTRLEDIVFAKVVNGRDQLRENVSDLFGLFINTILVRIKWDRNTTVKQLLKNIHRQSIETKPYEYTPLELVIHQNPLGAKIYQTLFSLRNYIHEEKASFLSLKPVLKRQESAEELDAGMELRESGELEIEITYNTSLYSEKTIKQLVKTYELLICGMVDNPDLPVSQIPRLSEEDRLAVMALSRGEELPYDKTQTWVDIFHNQAEVQPDHIAVVDSTGSITYADLDRQSNIIANYLIQHGVRQNDFVAVRMDRVKEFPIAVLGVNKAGAAYLPLDPDYPDERIKYMLEDSQANIVLTESVLNDIIKQSNTAEYINRATPDTLAYMIYTSGSTGKPKGVMISQHSLLNFLSWYSIKMKQNSETKHLNYASFAFDTSLSDTICPLFSGAEVYIADNTLRHDLDSLVRFINEKNITGLDITTQVGMELINSYTLNIQYIMLGGEKMLPVRSVPYRVYNSYGPTEFTSTSAFYMTNGTEQDIPIGRPVPNTSSFICDSYGNLLPQGVAGELCHFGIQMADGYWNNPEKTKTAFVECPFIHGEKMYRTGDLARYNEDGNLVYLGRLDRQIKLRGFRIELGEIENRASQFTCMEKIAAEVRKDQLCLYYTASDHIDIDALRAFMSQTLPEYMVPTVFMQMDSMPMTPSGKIDRKKLPEPDLRSAKTEYASPTNEIELKIVQAMEEVTGVKPIGIDDDFFALGGNSIKSMRLLKIIGFQELTALHLAQTKTPRALAGRYQELLKVKESKSDILKQNFFALYEELPLTESQIFILNYQFYTPLSTMWNIGFFCKIGHTLDIGRFTDAVNKVIKHHPILSSRIILNDVGEYCLTYSHELFVEIKPEEISEEDLLLLKERLNVPFTMLNSQLYMCRIFKTPSDCYLFFNVHHIIADGRSLELFLSNLKKAYQGDTLKVDYVFRFLKQYAQQATYSQYKEWDEYFYEKYHERNWTTIIPPDYSSDENEQACCETNISFSEEKFSLYKARYNIISSFFFETVAFLTLAKMTASSNVCLEFSYHGRINAEREAMFGYLLKDIPVPIQLKDNMLISDLFQTLIATVKDGLSKYGFCHYGDKYSNPGTEALAFLYQENVYTTEFDAEFPLTFMDIPNNYPAAQELFIVELIDNHGQRSLRVSYMSTRYKRETVERFTQEYLRIAAKLLDSENDITVGDVLE